MGICACCGFRGLPSHLFLYPLNVLSVIKVFIQLCILGGFYCWSQLRSSLAPYNSFLVIATLLSLILLVNSISIVFLVQKFYWTKVECGFSGVGTILSIISLYCSTSLITIAGTNENFISLKVILVLLFFSNMLNCFWAYSRTYDSVSNLYIQNWGQEEFSVELAELQNDFDNIQS